MKVKWSLLLFLPYMSQGKQDLKEDHSYIFQKFTERKMRPSTKTEETKRLINPPGLAQNVRSLCCVVLETIK